MALNWQGENQSSSGIVHSKICLDNGCHFCEIHSIAFVSSRARCVRSRSCFTLQLSLLIHSDHPSFSEIERILTYYFVVWLRDRKTHDKIYLSTFCPGCSLFYQLGGLVECNLRIRSKACLNSLLLQNHLMIYVHFPNNTDLLLPTSTLQKLKNY